ncbi:hypothetical protein EI42_05646 [Thermosporothrix hazakensis]|uniref:MerR-like DNA binding protein n=1 Tax=Thermosporothrix hazakensis TaxID=644383 RepID=A0A326TXL8_THEHA|nr:hypothetical protein EI42_05646 [Thermosporothrix hazakensis]GCE50725.1 hypothetical protein KTH_55940 [Thermosporothrix hazakensis]
MQHHSFAQEEPDYISLKEVEQEVGISRVILRKYQAQFGITPHSFHVQNRSLYIRQAEKERIKRLKQNPTLLEKLREEQSSSPIR